MRGELSAVADVHGQREEWQLSGNQLSPRLLQSQTAAFPATDWQDPELSINHENFNGSFLFQAVS